MSERKREGELLREGLGTRDVTVRVLCTPACGTKPRRCTDVPTPAPSFPDFLESGRIWMRGGWWVPTPRQEG